ncbi:MAG TPA: O-antigen ligase family protein [Longimicrobiales bacterium]|nr:O-antigen ligase family protein [Longimicrobiales bacterium]
MRTARLPLSLPDLPDRSAFLLPAALLATAAVVSLAAAHSPFLAMGAVVGALLTVFALTRPLAIVGLMLVIGPADLSVLTGGFKSMFEQLGGLDMNGIRLLGMSAALALVIMADRQIARQVFRPAAVFYVLLILYCAASLLFSPAPLDGARLVLKIAYPLLVFIVIVGLLPERATLDRLMDAVLVGAAVLCLVVNPLYLAFGGFEREIGGYIRLRGLGAHQNPFAFYLVAALLMSFVRFTTRLQIRYLLLCAVCSFWMVLTITRIASLAIVVALLTIGVVNAVLTRRTRALAGAVAAGVLLAIPFAGPVLQRTLGFVPTPGELLALMRSPQVLIQTMNWEGREAFWAVVFDAYLASPGLGLGMGASSAVLRLHFPSFSAPVVHNDYLRLLSEAGVVGVVLFGCALMAWWVSTMRAARTGDRTVREYALPAFGCIAALSIIGLTDNVFDYYGPFTQYVGFLCGGAVAAAAAVARSAADPATAIEGGAAAHRDRNHDRFRR